ncbi:MAG: SDR family oxidoreductase, partial [Clostridia bacterium]|nr:SDR family oxidoreductase [Clostridia bacterium]
MKFDDAIVVITGGTQGIGKAAATKFLKKGATTIIVGRDAVKGKTAAEELNAISGRCTYFQCDISKPTDIKNLSTYVEKEYGRVDVLFNNAGIALGWDLETTTVEEWDMVMSVNIRGTFLVTQKLLPLLR